MNSDIQMQHHVPAELEREPSCDAFPIGVTARDAEAARCVPEAQAVANETDIPPTDADIAAAGLSALKRYLSLPEGRIKVTASNGWATLEGTVDSPGQSDIAYHAVRLLAGVRGVSNHLVVTPRVEPEQVKDRITAAFQLRAELDARAIGVEVRDNTVVLEGHVRSWGEREEAELAAQAVPGISQVENDLWVIPQPEPLEAGIRP